MTNTSPISFLHSLWQSTTGRMQAPAWLVEEVQHRLVLLLNHVLMQEKEAQARLARRKGSVVQVRWGQWSLALELTPAGLTSRAAAERAPDLVLCLESEPPWVMARQLFEGQRPPVQIEGDVQLAAEIAWLADHLRWDVEEDLARLMGDVPAHALADAARKLLAALRPLLARMGEAAGRMAPTAAAS